MFTASNKKSASDDPKSPLQMSSFLLFIVTDLDRTPFCETVEDKMSLTQVPHDRGGRVATIVIVKDDVPGLDESAWDSFLHMVTQSYRPYRPYRLHRSYLTVDAIRNIGCLGCTGNGTVALMT